MKVNVTLDDELMQRVDNYAESEPLSAQPLPLKSAQPAPVTVRWLDRLM